MEQKNSLTIELAKQDIEDFNSFCKINEITDPNGFVKLCFRKGYYIEKYGLLNQGNLPDVIDREFEKRNNRVTNHYVSFLYVVLYLFYHHLDRRW